MGGLQWIAPAIMAGIAGLYIVALIRARRELAALIPVTSTELLQPLTVVIPARNEAHTIGASLSTLLADTSPHLSVTVWDDGSTDDTSDVVNAMAANDSRLELLQADGTPLEAGVFGKPRALANAVEALRRRGTLQDRLLFLDADVELRAGAIGGLVNAMETSAATVVSGTPGLILNSFAEQMWVPAFVSLVGERHRPTQVHDDKSAAAFLNGQCILVKTKALDAIGGFASVETTVLEDVALGQRLKKDGGSIRLADLRTTVATRMYASWSEIVEGFGKNARPVLGGKGALFRLVVLGLSLAFAPSVLLVTTVVQRGFGPNAITPLDNLPVVIGLLAMVCIVSCGAIVRREMGGAMWPAMVLPIVWTGVAFVLLRAALVDKVRWKGREYAAPTSSP